jgi:hypothetical protein
MGGRRKKEVLPTTTTAGQTTRMFLDLERNNGKAQDYRIAIEKMHKIQRDKLAAEASPGSSGLDRSTTSTVAAASSTHGQGAPPSSTAAASPPEGSCGIGTLNIGTRWQRLWRPGGTAYFRHDDTHEVCDVLPPGVSSYYEEF